ncbi:MAG: 4-alpha-glucanotransferase [Variovorax sp.]
MTDGEARGLLDRICERHGIATSYADVWGVRHDVPPERLVQLLRECGVELPADDAVDNACLAKVEADAERADWRRVLSPVRVLRAADDRLSATLRLPADVAQVAWRVEEESGEIHQGAVQTSALEAVGRAEVDGKPHLQYTLDIALALPLGYHRLTIAGHPGETLLVCAPAQCHRPPALEDGGRLWGLTLQLYGLRSRRNWGIGDFSDLAAFAAQAAHEGAGVIGVNPLHALFPHNPAHTSPYSPSSRAQLNALYIDVEAVPDFWMCEAARQRVESPAFQARLAELRETALVDHAGVAAAKHEILELLYANFRQTLDSDAAGEDPEVAALMQFRQTGGAALQQHALFEALQEHLHRADESVWGWPVWPEQYRDIDGPAVAEFAQRHEARIGYYEYLQWQAARQLEAAGQQCKSAGMPVGLYLDLAVSVDRGGSDAWRHRASFATGASVGAPPDVFNPNGQDWGLPPLRPDRLRETHYQVFIEALRANMRGAGAIRIDHVMVLMRLFWIPGAGSARDGAYVHYPFEELLAILALESERHRAS